MTKTHDTFDGLIDAEALRHRLTALTAGTDGDGSGMEVRGKVLAELKTVMRDAVPSSRSGSSPMAAARSAPSGSATFRTRSCGSSMISRSIMSTA